MSKFPGDILNLRKPYTPVGEPDYRGHIWYEQDGVLYAWSEGNLRFERARWLSDLVPDSPLVRKLREERPDPRAAGPAAASIMVDG